MPYAVSISVAFSSSAARAITSMPDIMLSAELSRMASSAPLVGLNVKSLMSRQPMRFRPPLKCHPCGSVLATAPKSGSSAASLAS